jgi:ParB family chromosome partitioning protein
LDAIKHQGKASRHVVGKLESADCVSDGESGRQVQRYIRLLELIPEILQMVDDCKIALTPAVELSYLKKSEQQDLLETMESEDCTPSLSQAQQLKKLSQAGVLTMDRIFEIIQESKANQIDKISFRVDDLRRYFPKSYSAARIQGHILKLLEADLRKRQRDLSR